MLHEGASSNADLVAHFFRRAFDKLSGGGTFGLIATNTIAQGDTRGAGLRWMLRKGGAILAARTSVEWPGIAAVTVTQVHLRKGPVGTAFLDGKEVPRITAFLLGSGGDDDPAPLAANGGLCLGGYKLAGQGFLFCDADPGATPLAEMERILAIRPACSQFVQPFLGGDELNNSPDLGTRRWAINLGRLSLEEACRWPELLDIVRTKVKPERDRANRDAHRTRWWQFGETRPGLTAAAGRVERLLVCASISTHLAWAWIPSRYLPSHNLSVVVLDSPAVFALLQSRAHDLFAAAFSSTLQDSHGYRPSDCFETFPFPPGWETDPTLESIGDRYHAFRADLMVRTGQGLTRTYNRFHDPAELDDSIAQLRRLHDDMDRAVLDAYGWTDIHPACEFLLDYEDEDEEDDDGRPRKRKRPWRYRWPDDIRDEVLARLLALNQQRAEEERLSGTAADKATKAKPAPKKDRRPAPSSGGLFE